MEACGGSCVGLMPRRGSGPVMHHYAFCVLPFRAVRRRSQTAVTSSVLVVILTHSYS